jgi:hypothetical protein
MEVEKGATSIDVDISERNIFEKEEEGDESTYRDNSAATQYNGRPARSG